MSDNKKQSRESERDSDEHGLDRVAVAIDVFEGDLNIGNKVYDAT